MSNEWIEVKSDKLEDGRATMRIDEDGKVSIFSASGYQKVELETLPQEIQQQLIGE